VPGGGRLEPLTSDERRTSASDTRRAPRSQRRATWSGPRSGKVSSGQGPGAGENRTVSSSGSAPEQPAGEAVRLARPSQDARSLLRVRDGRDPFLHLRRHEFAHRGASDTEPAGERGHRRVRTKALDEVESVGSREFSAARCSSRGSGSGGGRSLGENRPQKNLRGAAIDHRDRLKPLGTGGALGYEKVGAYALERGSLRLAESRLSWRRCSLG